MSTSTVRTSVLAPDTKRADLQSHTRQPGPVAERVGRIWGERPYPCAEPAGEWLLALRADRVSGRAGGAHGYAVDRECVPLYRVVRTDSGRTVVRFWSGLLDLVWAAMEADGMRVEVSRPARPPLWRATPYLSCDPDLIRFVQRHVTGVIRPDLSAGTDVVALVAQAALAFSDARVVVLVPDCAPVWHRALQRHLDECVGLSTHNHLYTGGDRVVVATPGALGTVGIDRADLVFVTEPFVRMSADPLLAGPLEPPVPGARYRLGQMELLADARGRMYAVVPRSHRPSPYELARLAQVFGTVEYVAVGTGRTERTVRVVWECLTGGPSASAGAAALDVKRTAVWRNPILARRGAARARALAAGEPIPHGAGLLPSGPRRVLVLVEGPEHLETVAPHLPGWTVVTADAPAEREFPTVRPVGVLATAPGAARLIGADFHAVVRLDLGVGLPPLPLPSWLDGPEPAPLLVVDFDVRTHPLLRRWTRTRESAYRAAGWGAVGVPDRAVALAQFAARVDHRRARS